MTGDAAPNIANPLGSTSTQGSYSPTGSVLQYATTKKATSKYVDPYGLGEQAGTALFSGAGSMFGLLQTLAGSPEAGFAPMFTTTPGAHSSGMMLNGDEIMRAFASLDEKNPRDAGRLAALQSQLYQAGYYGDQIPDYGHRGAEDLVAFRKFIIGAAASGHTDDLWGELSHQAKFGTDTGINQKKHTPLVITLTSPDDIRATLHATAMKLYGGDLNEEQTQAFINTFQSQEAAYQTEHYKATGFNPLSGQVDQGFTGAAQGATPQLTRPPSAEGMAYDAEQAIRQAHPAQVFASEFGRTMANILPGLAKPGLGLV